MVKTRDTLTDQVAQHVKKHHPYDTPVSPFLHYILLSSSLNISVDPFSSLPSLSLPFPLLLCPLLSLTYAIPQEFICTDVVAGLPHYLKWVKDSTKSP